ncbi:hypothetical protein WICPIJ_001735 [Wickerhamomyces pijperi]|uniref:HORMA domain-containing protein n=1 Tax=Wickerhamomyces pijperi TaxID=599730 RepID=A0A9P8TPL1_WICPI|nr:hypothetical protein WICPIJ_001735 [Wickerhamomyces pijperi]
MSSTESAPLRSSFTIRGSTTLITEFFDFSVNNILYQRGIYPMDDFKTVKKYGMNLLVTHDEDIKSYIRKFMKQVHVWLKAGKVSRFVLVIVNKNTGDVVEKWQFNINVNEEDQDASSLNQQHEISPEQIQSQIQAIIRQITSCVTFLPNLEVNEYTFNILVFTDVTTALPQNNEWVDSSDYKLNIEGEECVQLKSLKTNLHTVDTLVSYKTAN